MRIEALRVGDNYVYVGIAGLRAVVVDPGAASPVEALLRTAQLTLDLILITHHHGDHTGGCAALRRATGCRVAGPQGGSTALDRVVCDGDTIAFADCAIEVIEVLGHTNHDVAYYLPGEKAVFTGDTLFAAGCGRVFGGQAARLWHSLCRLRALPGDTRVYGGHDYTLENLEFAAHLEPGHTAVQARLRRYRTAAQAGAAPVVSTMAEERETNPFLRCDDEALATAAGLGGHPPETVFAAIRRRKDAW